MALTLVARRRGVVIVVMFRLRGGGQAAASRVCQSRGRRRRRDDGRGRQHDHRQGIRRPAARASALRRHGRARDGARAAASLFYLERLRIVHASSPWCCYAAGCWPGPSRCGSKAATTGDVILVCTLGLSVLHATRDLAVALVDVTQHMARFSEALATLLVPHQMRDHPRRLRLARRGASVTFEDVTFAYPDCPTIFGDLSFHIGTGQRVGPRGRVGRRQVDHLRPGAALLRHPVGAHPDRRAGRHAGHAAEPARGNRRRAAGHLACSIAA